MSFEHFALHPKVLAGVSSMGFAKPTPIQERSIPVSLQGRDVLGLAQTGTGKTAAFALPILHRLATTPPKKGVRCLIIAPTRELAEQILQTFRDLGQHLGIKSIAIYGGVSKLPQLTGLRRGAQIVVACPGRLLDHVGEKDIDLRNVEVLVLDEADTMCDMGFLPDVQRILNHLPVDRQTLLFSATMPAEIRTLAVKILKHPEMVQIGTMAPAKTVSHALYPVPFKLKKNLLMALLEQTPTGRALVFTRTKHRARTLALDLGKKAFRVGALQGNMSQTARQQAMDGFRKGKFDILVATDIAAHGIDVPEVSHVINFDFPNTTDTYTHRIGRTGRAEQSGEAFTLASSEDANMVREVERELGVKIERRRLSGFDYGNFTPETQFQEDRRGRHRSGDQGNNRKTGRSTSNSRPLTRQINGQNSRRSIGSTNKVNGPERSPATASQHNSNHSGRSEEVIGAGRRNRDASGPVSRAASSGPVGNRSNRARSDQSAVRSSRSDGQNGRSPGQMLGKSPVSESENRRRSGQLLGRSSSPNSSNGRSRGPKQGSSNFGSRPPGRGGRPSKPRGRSDARR